MSSPELLKQFCDEYWNFMLEECPEFATTCNAHQYDHLLNSYSIDAHDRKYTKCKEFLENTKQINEADLMSKEQCTFKLLKYALQTVVNGYKWRHYGAYVALNFIENLPNKFSGTLVSAARFLSKEDFERYIQRLSAVPVQTDEQIALLNETIKAGTTCHAVTLQRIFPQYEGILAKPARDSTFFSPLLKKLPQLDLSAEDKVELEKKCEEVIVTKVFAAMRKMLDYLTDIYMPQTRKGYGVGSLPNGKEFYQECLKWHLTADMSPEEVHKQGQAEVERIHRNMEAIKDKDNFKGSLADYFEHIEKSPEYYYEDGQSVLNEFKNIIYNHIEPKLSALFDVFPSCKVDIQEMPFDGPGGMYYPGLADGSRAGVFYANLNRPKEIANFTMMALSLHEASPGHHFQITRGMEEDLPTFQKQINLENMHSAPFNYPMFTGYLEGWALYGELLGEEISAYRNPKELFGRYMSEMMRACRLVMDTGLHAFNWSRQEAIDYMVKYSGEPKATVEIEVDRYITWPGQACGYKIGEFKIRELRKLAEEELSDKFSLKKFHNVLLQSGALPLFILEELVKEWIKESK